MLVEKPNSFEGLGLPFRSRKRSVAGFRDTINLVDEVLGDGEFRSCAKSADPGAQDAWACTRKYWIAATKMGAPCRPAVNFRPMS